MTQLYDLVKITVKNDDEGFLGAEGADSIDFDKSLENYENKLRKALKDNFPGAEINLEYGPYSGKSIYVSIDCEDVSDLNEHEISEEVGEIVGRIYENGQFWVDKK